MTPGSATTGIDASLVRAGVITGHVTDREGNPLSGICAQATSDTAFGGLGRTDESGNYTILLAAAGSFRVQFVDCNDTTKWRTQWWDDQPTAATAALVTVGAGGTVHDVDAHLDPGGPATISGNVTTLRGATPDSGCVVAYLPNQFAKFVPVAADGSYTITDVPSGTFALAALSCADGGEPSPVVPDPSLAGVAYRGLWWNNVPLVFDQGPDGGPDPIAEHADLVTVNPGDALTGYDFCFGCDAVELQAVNPTGTSVEPNFTAPDLVSPVVQSQAVVPGMVYTATCTTSSGGENRSASGEHPDLGRRRPHPGLDLQLRRGRFGRRSGSGGLGAVEQLHRARRADSPDAVQWRGSRSPGDRSTTSASSRPCSCSRAWCSWWCRGGVARGCVSRGCAIGLSSPSSA